jgi:hypothetical protein
MSDWRLDAGGGRREESWRLEGRHIRGSVARGRKLEENSKDRVVGR